MVALWISGTKGKSKMREVLRCSVQVDEILRKACEPFDYPFEGESTFEIPCSELPKRNGEWAIGVIVGPSGSGKTQMLKKFYGISQEPEWNPKLACVSHFKSHENAIERLSAVGLNSVPSWCKPYHVLSNGEQFRARMARMIESNTAFDEFTSVVDRSVAKSCSNSLKRHIDKNSLKGIVFSTCHYDILEWLRPDWAFDTLTRGMMPRGSLQCRPEIPITIVPCERDWWDIFKNHHYMTTTLNSSSRCFLAYWGDMLVGFASVLSFPSGTVKNAWRGHRTVILPDYQGLGIGVRLSDAVAQMFVDMGCRYYSKTMHPRMGEYRNRSKKWRPTAHNMKDRKEESRPRMKSMEKTFRSGKMCYCHEYIG